METSNTKTPPKPMTRSTVLRAMLEAEPARARRLLRRALMRARGDATKAAQILDTSYRSFCRIIEHPAIVKDVAEIRAKFAPKTTKRSKKLRELLKSDPDGTRASIVRIIRKHEGSIVAAAKELGIHFRSLYRFAGSDEFAADMAQIRKEFVHKYDEVAAADAGEGLS